MALVAICPYFQKSEGKRAFCEICTLNFKDAKMRNDFVSRYCASFDYKDCTVCKASDAYYNRKDTVSENENECEEII